MSDAVSGLAPAFWKVEETVVPGVVSLDPVKYRMFSIQESKKRRKLTDLEVELLGPG